MQIHGSIPLGVAFGEAEYQGPRLNVMRVYVRQLDEAFEDPNGIRANLEPVANYAEEACGEAGATGK